MSTPVHRYLRLLKAELDDLIEDLEVIGTRYQERFDRNEIGSFVFQENEALFKREIDAVGHFKTVVDGIEPSLYKGVDELETTLLEKIDDLAARFEDPEAVSVFLRRKFAKVRAYLASGAGMPDFS